MSIIDQLRMILDDQSEDLADVRRERKELRERSIELDAKEIELRLGIEKTREELRKHGVEE